MGRVLKKIIIIFAVFILIFIGHKARVFRYDFAPQPLSVLDEYAFAWQGISLLNSGIPVSWSGFEVYENPYPINKIKKWQRTNIQIDGKPINFRTFRTYSKPETFTYELDLKDGKRQIHFVQPFLDHPPLAGLIIGGYEYLRGSRFFSDVSAINFRRPALYSALLTSFLIFLLGTMIYGKAVGLLALAIYNTVPTFVISSRMALAENFLNPLSILFILFFLRYLKTNSKTLLLLCSLVAGIAILIKISGIYITLAGVFLMLWKKQPFGRILSFIAISLFIGGVTLFIYGWYYDFDLFKKILLSQGNRTFLGPLNFIYSIIYPRITVTKVINDGWVLAGFISLFIMMWSKLYRPVILIPLFSYILIFLFMGSNDYGWYRYPLFPWMSLSLAVTILETFRNPNFGKILIFTLLPTSSSFATGLNIKYWQPFFYFYRGAVLLLVALFTVELLGKLTISKYKGVVSFIFLAVIIISMVLSYNAVKLITSSWYTLREVPLVEF